MFGMYILLLGALIPLVPVEASLAQAPKATV